MARIKAKPMARLPMGPVGGVPAMKSGNFKSTPPPPVFDPAAAGFTPPQRYVYTNGPTIPGPVSYNVFVSRSMSPPWDLLINFHISLVAIPAAAVLLSGSHADMGTGTAARTKLLRA